MLDELLTKYVEKFEDNYPLRCVPCGWDEEEIISNIKECIKDNKPYEPKLEEADY